MQISKSKILVRQIQFQAQFRSCGVCFFLPFAKVFSLTAGRGVLSRSQRWAGIYRLKVCGALASWSLIGWPVLKPREWRASYFNISRPSGEEIGRLSQRQSERASEGASEQERERERERESRSSLKGVQWKHD